jgi:hypothetical protein
MVGFASSGAAALFRGAGLGSGGFSGSLRFAGPVLRPFAAPDADALLFFVMETLVPWI